MKQIVVFNRQNMQAKYRSFIDNVKPNEDIVSPKKTTFLVKKTDKVEISDYIIIQDGNTIEFLGFVQDVAQGNETTISAYPLIEMFDQDCILTELNGNVFDWIKQVIQYNYMQGNDPYLDATFVFVDDMATAVTHSYPFTDDNLLEALLTIYKQTGVYLTFNPVFTNGQLTKIECRVKNAKEIAPLEFRYDNPLLSNTPVEEVSLSQGTNKLIVKSKDGEVSTTKPVFIFYLLNDNSITQDATSDKRIKGVVQEIATYEETTEAVSIASDRLIGDAYSHQIIFEMKRNDSYPWRLYNRVKFYGEHGVYNTFVSAIEYENDYLRVTLGQIRNTLADKIKSIIREMKNG